MADPYFIFEMKLNTNEEDNQWLQECFWKAYRITNIVANHARRAIAALRQDVEYKTTMADYRKYKKDPVKKEELTEKLNALRMRYGLTKGLLYRYVKQQQYKDNKYIDSVVAQSIVNNIWKGVQTVLFGKGKNIRNQRYEQIVSIEGRSNVASVRYKHGCICYHNRWFPCQIDKKDKYQQDILARCKDPSNDTSIRYCRIVRKPIGSKWHYYAQLIIKGVPYKKHSYKADGKVGIDPGVSSEAIVSKEGCELNLIEPRLDIANKITQLQRQMDRSRRTTNPDNYNKDGTVKPKKDRKPWKYSNNYKRIKAKLRSLRRKNTAYLKQQETILVNHILTDLGSDVITEKMNYSALARRSKISNRARFGKTISLHAPARFLTIINQKLTYIGKLIIYVNTKEYRASQYDHSTNEYTKADLSQRSKTIDGKLVQRDLYSAYLLYNMKNTNKPSRQNCIDNFDTFVKQQNECIDHLINSGKTYPSSFGLDDFKHKKKAA